MNIVVIIDVVHAVGLFFLTRFWLRILLQRVEP